MKLDMLDTLKDDELREVIARAGELLKAHDRERKDAALKQASAILAAAGLSLNDVGGKGRGGKSKPPAYRGGRHYQHPTRKELVWNAKGQKPNWLRELEREGGRAVEVSAQAANENAVQPVMKPA